MASMAEGRQGCEPRRAATLTSYLSLPRPSAPRPPLASLVAWCAAAPDFQGVPCESGDDTENAEQFVFDLEMCASASNMLQHAVHFLRVRCGGTANPAPTHEVARRHALDYPVGRTVRSVS